MKKVTALLEESLISDVQELTKGKNITESLTIALKAYVKRVKLMRLLKETKEDDTLFQDFDYQKIRELNRKVT